MIVADALGLRFSGASQAGLECYGEAARTLRCLLGDPLANLSRALEHCPDMVMGYVLRGFILLLSTEPGIRATVAEDYAKASTLPCNAREQRYLTALQALYRGQWAQSGQLLAELSASYPRDVVALQLGHQIDFFRGDAMQLRGRVAAALPAWEPTMPGWHGVLGMYAFGLEECGDYDAAEEAGLAALAAEPDDCWALHAVAHVREMRGSPLLGRQVLNATRPRWASRSLIASHLSWHLALFQLTLGEAAAALATYDSAIAAEAEPAIALRLVDASSLLWRLQLHGVDVGDRWQALAKRWLGLDLLGTYAFNDLHAALAFAGAERHADLAAVQAAQRVASHRDDDNARVTKAVGSAAVDAIAALTANDLPRATELLGSIQHDAWRLGGSIAQRQLLPLTLQFARGHECLFQGRLRTRKASSSSS